MGTEAIGGANWGPWSVEVDRLSSKVPILFLSEKLPVGPQGLEMWGWGGRRVIQGRMG